MALGATGWVVLPLVGAAIGYLTNRLAVRMIFRPIEPRRVLGLHVQGLVPRRKHQLAERIGRVVGEHLVRHEDVVEALAGFDVQGLVDRAIERAMAAKLADLRRLPLIGGLLTEERMADLRRHLSKALVADTEGLVEEFERAVEQGLDVRSVVTRRIEGFPVERLEALILEVAARELRSIELLGGLLGLAVGLAQAGLLAALG